jgi:hypothetical protein
MRLNAQRGINRTFLVLLLAQAAHSLEEYAGRLWEEFPPARYVSGLVSPDLRQGFAILNLALVAFGAWCFLWPLRRQWPSAGGFAWLWVGIELVNGIGHPLWAIRQGGYAPGVATAPLLLVLALYLASQLRACPRASTTG